MTRARPVVGLALCEPPSSMFGIPVGFFTIPGDINVVRSGHDACSMTDDDVVCGGATAGGGVTAGVTPFEQRLLGHDLTGVRR